MSRPAACSGGGPVRRAERLLRWYPAAWRARYGDEFTELLIAEMAERPRSWRRAADVAWSGLLARLDQVGLSGRPPESAEQAQRSLATLGCAAAVFTTIAIAMWAQLSIGWRWSPPGTAATSAAMVLMSGAALALAVLAAAAAVPVAWTLLRLAVHSRGRASGLAGPSALFLAAAAVLVAGGRHFGNGWPGTGGHPWAHQGLVPAGPASFGWASTLSVSSYWAHPGALLEFPAGQIAWMAVSPVAIACAVTSAARLVRRLEMSDRVLRCQARVARCVSFCMMVFLAGSGAWILGGGPGPGNLFHAGAIDVAGLVVMTIALVVACRAARQAGRAPSGPRTLPSTGTD